MHPWRSLLKFSILAGAFLLLTGAQSNGCGPIDPVVVCEPVADPECPDGTLEPGGVDDQGCPLPAVCVPDPCMVAGGVPSVYCVQDDACPDRDCGCDVWCDCGELAYFDGQACVPFPDPCSESGGTWGEFCQEGEPCVSYCVCPDGATYDEWQGCVVPPDPGELCEATGGVVLDWCGDDCWQDEDGDGQVDDCGAEPVCWTDCDCGPTAYFDPFAGCVAADPRELCELTGGRYCDGSCECPWGTTYDPWMGCVQDPWVLCDGTGGIMEVVCAEEDGAQEEGWCWEECVCPDGYYFDYAYGCYPGPELLCEWSGGVFDEQCVCPDGMVFDWYSGCVPDYASLCVQAGGEWVTTCDEQWGSCWDDCVCPVGTIFDWVGACVAYEDCGNGLDDDGNGLADCDDPSCAYSDPCYVPDVEVCDDGVDDDLDGLVDCEDPDCADGCWIY